MVKSLNPSVVLRRTAESDAEQVVDILRSTVDWYRPFTDPEDLDTQHDVDRAWALENFEKREFWSAVMNGRVVGILTLQEAGDHLYLGYVYVHKEFVGNRIGRRLLDHAASELERRDLESMVLLTHPEAKWAVKAYRKYGFELIADTDESVVAWNDGWLEEYHEKGFGLWSWSPEA